ncbi:sensor histidine kinase [Nocardia sp. NPDC050175]|uniref:sensor histidine kinase n=1 Tax=Nocardia sp. NPDC050175 TaxID=3364317 RepID=UPI003799F6B1
MSELGDRPRVASAVDLLLAAIGAFDVWCNRDLPLAPWEIGIALLTGSALLARRRAPIVTFVLTLPAAMVIGALLAPMTALYTVARSSVRRWVVAVFAVVLGLSCLFTSSDEGFGFGDLEFLLHQILFAALVGAGPAALGWLVATRQRLAGQMAEIDRVYAHDRRLQIAAARERERAELASEMHDVVSHQVSLIAVQAGALQMVSTDPDARSTAEVIRKLSVHTLDELRHMVKVLRAPASANDISPQPTIERLPELLTASALPVELIGPLPVNLTPAGERAVYRTVQEALTNVRKHAPGAAVTITSMCADRSVAVSITNVASTEPPVALPSAGSGIRGLRQRAELLGGTVTAQPLPGGGWTVRIQLPRN